MNLAEAADSRSPKFLAHTKLAFAFVQTHFQVIECLMSGNLIDALSLSRDQAKRLFQIDELCSTLGVGISRDVASDPLAMDEVSPRVLKSLPSAARAADGEVTSLLRVVQAGGDSELRLFHSYSEHSHKCFGVESFVAIHFLDWLIVQMCGWLPNADYSSESKSLQRILKEARRCNIV